MKPDSEINEAALVAGFSSFSKELAGLSFENVNSGAFVAAVGRLVDRIYPDVVSVLYYRLESGGKLTCTFPLSDAPCSPEDFEAHIGGSKKLEIEYHNQGCFVDKKYSAYAVVSFFLKKELFFSVVLCGKKRELRDVAQTLPAFQSYVASEFRRLRSVHKEIKSARRSEQATLLSTTRYLLRNRGGKRWFSEYTDSGTPLGTDFTGLYPCGSDGWLSCLFDITVASSARLQVMVLLDAYMALLAEEGCTTDEIARRTLLALKKKTMELYLSFAIVHYDMSNGTIAITGAGSCTIFFVSHDSGRVTEIVFGIPAGSPGNGNALAFTSKRIDVASGDILCVCSDGLVQAARGTGESSSGETIPSLLAKYSALSADGIAKKIKKSLDMALHTENVGMEMALDDRTFQVFKCE